MPVGKEKIHGISCSAQGKPAFSFLEIALDFFLLHISFCIGGGVFQPEYRFHGDDTADHLYHLCNGHSTFDARLYLAFLLCISEGNGQAQKIAPLQSSAGMDLGRVYPLHCQGV